MAVGVGARKALAASAAINWMLKDGMNRLVRMGVATQFGDAFDSDLKVWGQAAGKVVWAAAAVTAGNEAAAVTPVWAAGAGKGAWAAAAAAVEARGSSSSNSIRGSSSSNSGRGGNNLKALGAAAVVTAVGEPTAVKR